MLSAATKSISLKSYEAAASGRALLFHPTFQVQIPKGVTEGSVIRLSGQGEKGYGGGAAGDLMLRIHFAPDSRFKVSGHDLHTVVAVSPWEVALGGKVDVQTVDGSVS